MYWKLKFVVGSFRLDSVLLTQGSIMEPWYAIWEYFINNCRGPLTSYLCILKEGVKIVSEIEIHIKITYQLRVLSWLMLKLCVCVCVRVCACHIL